MGLQSDNHRKYTHAWIGEFHKNEHQKYYEGERAMVQKGVAICVINFTNPWKVNSQHPMKYNEEGSQNCDQTPENK